tara:strand:- start:152 stop:1117 length:966 start_codon:yes stop_codon:yes gene_type:complete
MESNYADIQSIENLVRSCDNIKKEVSKVIVGQKNVIEKLLMTIFSGGHAVLIGVPGLAKTLLVNSISQTLGLQFNRIQFTPDLMPSDIMGAEIIDNERNFKFVKGPLFGNIILADEINRTPPKTQSALLEAMQEKSVTVSGKTYNLNDPFFVLATQNPIEQEGTYPLPEAQLDRFMFSIVIDYPSLDDELQIVKNTTTINHKEINKVLTFDEILNFQKSLLGMPVTNTVYSYAVELVRKTRPNAKNCPEDIKKFIDFGAGPRASQYLILGSKMHAVLRGKYSPDIEDVRAVSEDVLRHRLVKNYKAEAEGITIEKIIQNLF